MKKLLLTLGAAVVGLLLMASTGEAERPAHAGGPKHATIALDQTAPSWGDIITFTVTSENYAPGVLWTAVKCYQNGDLVAAGYQPVGNGYTLSAVDLGGSLTFADPGPDLAASADCTGYVWEFPNTEPPEKYHGQDVAVSFTVEP